VDLRCEDHPTKTFTSCFEFKFPDGSTKLIAPTHSTNSQREKPCNKQLRPTDGRPYMSKQNFNRYLKKNNFI
jgi:hypothetical protein